MTIAEICGKISRTGQNLSERMENLLTSDVFSACRYVRPENLLLPFLRQAKQIDNESLGPFLEEQVKNVQYLFWPRLPQSEPDVLIAIEFSSGYFFLTLIEVKYLSLKSSPALDEEELGIAETPRDQLAREYLDLLDAHSIFSIQKSKVSGRALVYITAHRSIPKESLIESHDEIKKFILGEDNINLFWTSWFELYPIVSQPKNTLYWESLIIDDLRYLLERKHLVHFRGFSLDNIESIPNGFTYKREVIERPVNYDFVLVQEIIEKYPIFYLSKTRIREYRWELPVEQLVDEIYKGGIKYE